MPQLLLVEDDPAIRTALTRALTERGHGVRSAATGMAGLQAAVGGDLAAGLAPRLARVRAGAPVVILVHGYKFHPGALSTDPHRSLYAFRPAAGNRRIRSWPAGLGIAEDDGAAA